jgi:2TM domain
MLHDVSPGATTDGGQVAAASREQFARQQAIKQIRRRRRFRISAAFSTVGMILLAAIWAITEYHNAGGWPTSGFSQSSGIHDVWNGWIIYPLIAWVLLTVAHGWSVYGHKPISEREIQREIERQGGPPR